MKRMILKLNKESNLMLNAGFKDYEIAEFVAGMKRKLIINGHKGNSWRTCPIQYLNGKLFEELSEYLKKSDPLELEDVANICLMLYLRLMHD